MIRTTLLRSLAGTSAPPVRAWPPFRSRAAPIATADRRLRSPSEIRSRQICASDRATLPLSARDARFRVIV